MKHIYFSFFLLFFVTTNAQLTLTNLSDNSPINDGDVLEYTEVASIGSTSEGKLKFKILNSSSTETIRVFGQIVSYTNTDGLGSQFCISPSCFFNMSEGQMIPNAPKELAPGEDNGDFDSFYNSDAGDGVNYPITYTLRFFMVDGQEQEIGDDITITYSYTPENFSISDLSLKDLGITLQNTVISETLDLKIDNKISFKLFDLNARLINNHTVNSGIHSFNMSNLNSGYYLLVFKDSLGRKSQIRVLKK